MTEGGSKRGYDADVSDSEDGERPPKKSKDNRIAFEEDYVFSEHGCSMQDDTSTASGTSRAETDTEVDSACSEIYEESSHKSESLRSHDTSDYESDCVSETLGSDDTRSSDEVDDSDHESSSGDESDESDHESSSGDESGDVFGGAPVIDFDDARSEAPTV